MTILTRCSFRRQSPPRVAIYEGDKLTTDPEDSSEAERAFVLVDLGRAYDKSNEVAKAVQSFVEASTRNPQYATAFLQLGVLQGRQQEPKRAFASLDKAESIYQALGNLEGRTEAVFQRGALFNKLNKLAEAKAQLEQALNLARANNNKYQTIKTLLQLSSVTADSGEMTRATEHAREAVDLAQKNGMENLSALGLIDLGNTFLIRGDYADADKYLIQALETAQRAKARRTERARGFTGKFKFRQTIPQRWLVTFSPRWIFTSMVAIAVKRYPAWLCSRVLTGRRGTTTRR